MDTEEPVDPVKNKRDIWDKLQIILHPVGGLITALTIALVSYLGSVYLNNRQDNESKIRLYTELMSRREQAESDLRKDMFNSILGTILKESQTLDEKILQLELLAYNFHESLNLMPLFVYLDRQISNGKNIINKEEFRKRLYKMARDVTSKQIAILESKYPKKQEFIFFSDDTAGYKKGLSQELSFNGGDGIVFNYEYYDTLRNEMEVTVNKSLVKLTAKEFNIDEKYVNVRLDIESFSNEKSINLITQEFSIDFFQFPMIDNTRLSNDMRCAVVMRDFDVSNKYIEVDILYFPGSLSSLKEKPYYDEVVKKLLVK